MAIRVGMYTEVYTKVMVSKDDLSFRAIWWDNGQEVYDRPGIVNGCAFCDIGTDSYYYIERRFVRR